MAPTAGWYDDPRDESRLRYWDGEAWTDHTTPKQTTAEPGPAAAQPTGARAATQPASPPESPQWHYPGSPPARQQTWRYGAAPPEARHQTAEADGVRLATADGEPLASWGKRLAARLLDFIFVGIGGLPFTGYFVYRFFQALSDQLDDPTHTSLLPTSNVVKWEASMLAMFLVVYACYEVFSLRRWSATPGKRVMEVRIRSLHRAGPLQWPAIARRVGFMYGLAALNLVPTLSVLALILVVLDYLWPLWDRQRQALHDKVAGTVVVESPKAADAPRFG